MINLQRIIDNPGEVIHLLNWRGPDYDYRVDIEKLGDLEIKRKELQSKVNNLQYERNLISKRTKGKPTEDQIKLAKSLENRIQNLDSVLNEVKQQKNEIHLEVPNIPDKSIPLWYHKADKRIISESGIKHKLVEDHETIGTKLGILDFKSGITSTGAGFPYYKKEGAELEFALLSYFIDRAKTKGYEFHLPPILVSEPSMKTAGTFPKFREQVYEIEKDKLYLVPTAEVVLVGTNQDRVFREDDLPLLLCAYTPCFRREAGTYGKDNKGILRIHQFNKLELFAFTTPQNSNSMLEEIKDHAASLVEELGLPYRVALLASCDIGQASAKTYDIEVFMPSINDFIEVSSCSNCTDYQARRGNIKYKQNQKGGKNQYVHTLNGSGLATPRVFAAILENFYTSEGGGNVRIPDVLVKYFGREWLVDKSDKSMAVVVKINDWLI